MYLLDTDVLVDVFRGLPAAVDWVRDLGDAPMAVAGLAAMEVVQGARDAREMGRLVQGIDAFALAWPSELDCRHALADFAAYRLAHGVGLIDALIAHTALGAGATLCTFNVKHYRPFAGLTLERPYARA